MRGKQANAPLLALASLSANVEYPMWLKRVSQVIGYRKRIRRHRYSICRFLNVVSVIPVVFCRHRRTSWSVGW